MIDEYGTTWDEETGSYYLSYNNLSVGGPLGDDPVFALAVRSAFQDSLKLRRVITLLKRESTFLQQMVGSLHNLSILGGGNMNNAWSGEGNTWGHENKRPAWEEER